MSNYKAAVVGLGAMGMGIACSSLKVGIDTTGCDVSTAQRDAFESAGGNTASSPKEAAANADCIAVVVVNQDQSVFKRDI